MKKIFFVSFCIILMSGLSFASPFLVCDCQDNVEQYVIDFNGTVEIIDADLAGCQDGQGRLYYNLSDIVEGQYNVTLKAKNIWGESVAVPFVFSKSLPGSPSNIGLSAAP